MQPIGRVKTISPKGHLIVMSSHAPRMGVGVVDERGRYLGKIIRVFGPVRRPYVAVLPLRERSGDLMGLLGKPLFRDESMRGGRYGKEKKDRRGRRRDVLS